MPVVEDSSNGTSTKLRVAILLVAMYLLLGGLAGFLSPFGWWNNYVFGQRLWIDTDPGYWYVAGSHETFGKGATFAGHPGVPLRLLVHGIQKLNYLVFSGPTGSVDYSAFTARSLGRVFGVAKFAIALLNLVSFYLLFRFCKRLSCSDRAATLATLAYATSWPTLFHAARISVEPMVVICFLGAFLSSWKCREMVERGVVPRAVAYAGLAALATVTGFFTKLHFHFALPIWVLPQLLAAPPASEPRGSALRTRVVVGASYVLAAVAISAAFSSQVDWKEFRRVWVVSAEATPAVTALAERSLPAGILAWIPEMVSAMGSAYRDGFLAKIFSGRTATGIFLHCEWAFLLLAVIGGVDFMVRQQGLRVRLLWVMAYTLAPMPLILYRYVLNATSFHYFFLPLVVASVLVGYLLDRVLVILRPVARMKREAVTVVTLVALLHLPAIWAAGDAKLSDIRVYNENWRPFVRAWQQVATTERVGVITDREPIELYYLVNQTMYVWMSTWRVSLALALRDSLHFASHHGRSHRAVAEELRQAGVAVVVDCRRSQARREAVSLAEWEGRDEP